MACQRDLSLVASIKHDVAGGKLKGDVHELKVKDKPDAN